MLARRWVRFDFPDVSGSEPEGPIHRTRRVTPRAGGFAFSARDNQARLSQGASVADEEPDPVTLRAVGWFTMRAIAAFRKSNRGGKLPGSLGVKSARWSSGSWGYLSLGSGCAL